MSTQVHRPDCMTPRERFHAVMSFKPFDRLPLVEWATWWDKTIERWHTEGLPPAVDDRYDLYDYFGMEQYAQQWVPAVTPDCPVEPSHGAGIMSVVEDYERLRPMLYPTDAVDENWLRYWAVRQQKGEAVLWFTLDGFFWFPRRLLGIARHLYAFFDEPELMHRINTDLAAWELRVIDQICSVCTPDFMTFGEDMSYNHGPMVSKPCFDEFLKPYYERVVPKLVERGIKVIIDSDGDVTIPAHWFEEVGIQGVLPLERQAGVDIAQLRADHPRMLFIGHFDKMTMTRGEDAMRTEFERLLPTAAQGGFIISCDHQTPPGVSLEEYQIYLRLFREYAARAGSL
jgi:hypothetical protein